MYLHENKERYGVSLIKDIENSKDMGDIVNIFEFQKDNTLNHFMSKVRYSLKATTIKPNSKSIRANILNLFELPPLSLQGEELSRLKESMAISKNIDKSFIDHYLYVFQQTLAEKIDKKEISGSPYEMVGHMTKNFNKLFYGKGRITKRDMDSLLVHFTRNIDNQDMKVIDKSSSAPENQLLRENKIKDLRIELKLMAEELNLPFTSSDLPISDYVKRVSTEISKSIGNEHYNNVNRLKFIRMILGTQNKSASSTNLKSMKEELILENEKINSYSPSYEKNEVETIKLEISKLRVKQLNLEIKNEELSLAEKYKNIILKASNNNKVKDYISGINDIKEIKLSKIQELFYDSASNIRTRFQKISKSLIELKEESLMVSLFDSSEKINSKVNDFEEKNRKAKKIKRDKSLDFLKDVVKEYESNKYSFQEVKEYLLLKTSSNLNLYNIYKKTNFLSNISNNKLIKDKIEEYSLISSSDTFGSKEKDLELKKKEEGSRLKYLVDILSNERRISDLFTTDININIKSQFYDKLGLTIDNELSQHKLGILFKIFQGKQDNLNYNNSNILLGVILESYENKKFSEEKFNKLFELVKTPIKKYTKEDKEELNKIEDKWLKWAICYNREVKDNSLVFSNVNPLEFNLSKNKTIDKLFAEVFGENKKMDKIERGLYYFIFDNNTKKNEFKNFIIKFNDSMSAIYKLNNRSSTNIKEFKELLHSVDNILGNINGRTELAHPTILSSIEKIKKEIANSQFDVLEKLKSLQEITDFINDNKESMNSVDLNKVVPIIRLLNGLRDNKTKDFILSNKELLNNIVENHLSTNNISPQKIERYLSYYDEMSKLPSVRNFKIEDSLIPVISKEIGNKYSYKIKTIKDFDILLTGEKTNCCMTINGQGFNIYKYMYENPKENVIFEVYKDGKPIANSWTWIKDNKICFDNIEVLGDEIRTNVIKAYQDIALEFVVNHGIEEVTLGTANSDINVDLIGNYIKEIIPQKHLNCYTDSAIQLGILSLDINNIDFKESILKIIDTHSSSDNELLLKYIDKLDSLYPDLSIDEIKKRVEDLATIDNDENSIK